MTNQQIPSQDIDKTDASEQVVLAFHSESDVRVLHYLLWFRNASGGNSYTDGVIDNMNYQTAQQMRDAVLKHQTNFVNNQWFLLEVCTPTRQEFGELEGGYLRLKIQRNLATLASANNPRGLKP